MNNIIDLAKLFGNEINACRIDDCAQIADLVRKYITRIDKYIESFNPYKENHYKNTCYLFLRSIVDYAKASSDSFYLGHFSTTNIINRTIIENYVCLKALLQHEILWKYWYVHSLYDHHSGQVWWARSTTDVQAMAGTRQSACGAFFSIRATYDGQLQSAGTELSGTPDFQSSDVCLSAAAPGDISSKPGFHPGPSGRKTGCNQEKHSVKEGVRAIMAGVAWRNSPHYAHYKAGWSGIRQKNNRQSLRGVKGYLGLYPGTAADKAALFVPTNCIVACVYGNKPHFSPFPCLISAIPAPDNWWFGRVAILAQLSDVCVHHVRDTPQTERRYTMRTQTFGIEIETTGLGRKRTAEVIAQHFGTTAQYIGAHLDDWKIPIYILPFY